MSDDIWRARDRDDEDDFGPPLFADADETTDPNGGDSERLSFGADTGSLPHWTEPPTGEIPRLARRGGWFVWRCQRRTRRVVVVLHAGPGVE